MTREIKPRPCGNPECSVSTGIHEGPTFGSGELDDYGFWEKPCRICAEAHDADRPRLLREAVDETIKEKIAAGETDPSKIWRETVREMRRSSWLFARGWPYAQEIPQNTYEKVKNSGS